MGATTTGKTRPQYSAIYEDRGRLQERNDDHRSRSNHRRGEESNIGGEISRTTARCAMGGTRHRAVLTGLCYERFRARFDHHRRRVPNLLELCGSVKSCYIEINANF